MSISVSNFAAAMVWSSTAIVRNMHTRCSSTDASQTSEPLD